MGHRQIEQHTASDATWSAVRLLDATPTPMGYVDADLTVRACSRSAAEILNRSAVEIIGSPVSQLFDRKGSMYAALLDTLDTGLTHNLHLQDISPEGHTRRWEVTMAPDVVAGSTVGVALTGVDVSDLTDAQQQLAQSERLYRSVGELLPFGTWIAEGDGRLTYLSDSFVKMTGRDGQSLLGWGWLDLLPSEEDRRRARAEWDHSLSSGSIRDVKHAIRAKDGTIRYVLCRGVRISDDSADDERWAGIHIDITDSERALRFRAALSDVKDLLVSTLDTEQLLEQVANAVLEPTGADFAAVISPQQGQWLEVRHAAGNYSGYGKARRLRRSEMPLVVRALDSGEIEVSVDSTHDGRTNTSRAQADGLQSIAVVPIKRRGVTFCALSLAYLSSQLKYDRALEDFLCDLTDSLDLALLAAQAHEHQRHIAETLQESLLAIPDHLPGVEVAHLYQAAVREERVGGDFYDAFALDQGIAVLVGDISGSGLEAAALTALAKNTIRAHLFDCQTPAGALTKTNIVMHQFTESHEFATVFVAVLEPQTGLLKYASAGHPPPFVVGPDRALPLEGGEVLLGAFSGSAYLDYDSMIDVDETLVLYTDGITEARRGESLYGDERLKSILAEQGDTEPSAVVERLFEDARSYSLGALGDDVAILAIRRSLQSS